MKKKTMVRFIGICICIVAVIAFIFLSKDWSPYLWIATGVIGVATLFSVLILEKRRLSLGIIIPAIIAVGLGFFTLIIVIAALTLGDENNPPCTIYPDH